MESVSPSEAIRIRCAIDCTAIWVVSTVGTRVDQGRDWTVSLVAIRARLLLRLRGLVAQPEPAGVSKTASVNPVLGGPMMAAIFRARAMAVCGWLVLAGMTCGWAQTPVTTWHYDNARSGRIRTKRF